MRAEVAVGRDFDEVVRSRRSVRGFVADKVVPRRVLEEAFELAQRAPSNCNTQPWRAFVVSGPKLAALKSAWRQRASSGGLEGDSIVPARFEGEYRQLQIECAVRLYERMGVAREDVEGRRAATLRNYDAFDAPHVIIVTMDTSFGIGVALDVGAWLQTLLLALESRGVASCAQASLARMPDVTREIVGIDENLRILCGVSIGYENVTVAANATRQDRRPIEHNVTFVD